MPKKDAVLIVCLGVLMLGLSVFGCAVNSDPIRVVPTQAILVPTPNQPVGTVKPKRTRVFPPTPTGEIPTPLPTLSKDELHRAPIADYPPDIPTLELTKDIPNVAPTIGRVVPITPSEKWVKYTDPYLGFSFQYPENWVLEYDGYETREQALAKGGGVMIMGYTVEGITKGGVPSDTLKIDIYVSRRPENIRTIRDWATQWFQIAYNKNIRFRDEQFTTMNGVPAFRSFGDTFPSPIGTIAEVRWLKGNYIYGMSGYPATTQYMDVFERVTNSLTIP